MTHAESSMLIPDFWVISENPQDLVAHINVFLRQFVHSGRLNELCDGTKRFVRIFYNSIHPLAFTIAQKRVFHTAKPTRFFEVGIDVAGSGQQVCSLFAYSSELIGNLKYLKGAVDRSSE